MSWAEIIGQIRTSSHQEVVRVACPICSGALAIEAVQVGSKSAIYVDCRKCGESARSSATAEPPVWVAELGEKIVTDPRH